MPRGRSWTDPFSNHIDLANVDVRENLQELVEFGGAPPALLLPLLHEATHHWCFLSPVGNVIAMVKARARKRALTIIGDLDENDYSSPPADDVNSLLLDLVMCKVATEALRPFGEGLALATELDSLTRKSPFLSVPFLSAARAFAPPTNTDPVTDFLQVDHVLIKARKDPAGLRRKLNVYADRIGPEGESYLLGYLAVRWMMRELGGKEARLIEETDLVIGFLRSFFYDDFQFIDTLLERDIKYSALANAIMGHIYSRFEMLPRVTPDDVREFERNASSDDWNRPGRGVSYSSFLHYDAELAERGIARTEGLVADLNEAPDISSNRARAPAALLRRINAELLNTRNLVDLGTCAVNIRVKDGSCSVALDEKILLQDVETTAGDMEKPGTIDVCYDTESTQDRLMIIATPEELLAVTPYGPVSEKKRQFPHISMSRSDLRNHISAFDKLLDAVAQMNSGKEFSGIMAQTPERIATLYLDPALSNVSDEQLDDTLTLLRAGGLRAVLGGDYDLAEALAVIGAVSQATPFRKVAENELKGRGLSTRLVNELLDLSARRIPLIAVSEQWLLSFV